MIIDSLTHVTPDGRWFHTDHDASEARLLREMDAANVTRAVVVALADYIPNEFVLDVCRRHPQRLLPAMSFNPATYSTPNDAVHEFRARLHDVPFKVLKLHPRLNRYDPLDPRALAVLEEIAASERPPVIWIDTLFHFPGAALRKSVPETISELVGRYPTLNFILLHSAGPWALQVAAAIRSCQNAFMDISFTIQRYAGSSVELDLRWLLEHFDRRLVFGSDFPEVAPRTALEDFKRLAHDTGQEKQENILGRNLQQLLKRD